MFSQFTQVEEYARDAYSRTGCSLIGTIASVHPFIITVMLNKVYHVIQDIGEVQCTCTCIEKEGKGGIERGRKEERKGKRG